MRVAATAEVRERQECRLQRQTPREWPLAVSEGIPCIAEICDVSKNFADCHRGGCALQIWLIGKVCCCINKLKASESTFIRYRLLRYRLLRYRHLRYRHLRYRHLRYRLLRYRLLRYRRLRYRQALD